MEYSTWDIDASMDDRESSPLVVGEPLCCCAPHSSHRSASAAVLTSPPPPPPPPPVPEERGLQAHLQDGLARPAVEPPRQAL